MIAQALFGAHAVVRRAERELAQLLDSAYGVDAWADFELDEARRGIDVYGVAPAMGAVDLLRDSGFAYVHEHEHERERFVHCDCRRSREIGL